MSPDQQHPGKVKEVVRHARGTMGRYMTKRELKNIEGLHTFVARFIHDDAHGSKEVYACI